MGLRGLLCNSSTKEQSHDHSRNHHLSSCSYRSHPRRYRCKHKEQTMNTIIQTTLIILIVGMLYILCMGMVSHIQDVMQSATTQANPFN